MEDWDLLAVVRGRNNNMEFPISTTTTSNSNNIITNMESQSSNCYFPLRVQDQDDLFHTYPHLFQTTTAFDELEELYKPFYPATTTATAAAVFNAPSSSLSSPSSSSVLSSLASLPKHAEIQASPKPKIAKEPANKYKKRKNQLKRVVKEVKEDGLSSDVWAWRKYGQKPIKGSPYPRSYYRCSSSKGCSARKQVERSPSNPDIFIITYTAEHSHAHPTRRNSLAGSTRSKFPSSAAAPKPPALGQQADHHHLMDSTNKSDDSDTMDCSSSKDHDGIDHEVAQDEGVKVEHDIDQLDGDSTTTSTEIDMKNVALLGHENNSQFFASLDDLERGLEELDEETSKSGLFEGGFFDDQFNISDANWFIDHYNTTVTGAC